MTKIVLTYEDFAALPDDGKRYELHEGELSVTPSPGRRHQTILGRLFVLLTLHVRATGNGEVFVSPFDVIMTNITVVEPDIVYVDHERLHTVSERGVEDRQALFAIAGESPTSRSSAGCRASPECPIVEAGGLLPCGVSSGTCSDHRHSVRTFGVTS
jgi:hypothetical protein